MVVDYEVAQIKAAFGHFGPDYKYVYIAPVGRRTTFMLNLCLLSLSSSPNLAVIVVKKRINTRLYKPGESPRDAVTNPPPGIIVDSVITRPMW